MADAPVARDFRLGQRVELFAPGIFESARQSRVIGWTKALDLPYDQPEYTFGESTAYSRLGDVEGKVETLIYRGQTYVGLGTGSGGPYVITSNDPTPASDSNVYSALRSRRRRVRPSEPVVFCLRSPPRYRARALPPACCFHAWIPRAIRLPTSSLKSVNRTIHLTIFFKKDFILGKFFVTKAVRERFAAVRAIPVINPAAAFLRINICLYFLDIPMF